MTADRRQVYVLATPVRNEMAFLPGLVESVERQTIRPVSWVVLDDSSSDGSYEWALEAAESRPWMTVRRADLVRKEYMSNIGLLKRSALEQALEIARAAGEQPEVVGILDADVLLAPDHYERMCEFFALNPRLGVSGALLRLEGEEEPVPYQRSDSPCGPTQMVRVSCLDEIGGYPPYPSVDSITSLKARKRGWEVEIAEHVRAEVRRATSGKHGTHVGYFRLGQRSHFIGVSPMLVGLRSLAYAKLSPRLSFEYARGWFHAWSHRAPRCPDPEVRDHYGRERLREALLGAVGQRKLYSGLDRNNRVVARVDRNQVDGGDSSGHLRRPTFFIVGAPKSGTSALFDYLDGHPELCMSALKEPEYFGEEVESKVPRMSDYLGLFNHGPTEPIACGEGSTSYLRSRCAAARILEFNPDAKFIAMLRNPVEAAPAYHGELLYYGFETIADFETAWRAPASTHLPPGAPTYREVYSYPDQLRRIWDLCPRERLKVILFDDFVADTRRVYEEVLAFLGAPSDGRTEFPPVNTSKWLRHPRMHRMFLAAARSPATRVFLDALGVERLGLYAAVREANRRKRPPLRPEFVEELRGVFRDEILELGEMLGRDLSHWLAPRAGDRDAVARAPDRPGPDIPRVSS